MKKIDYCNHFLKICVRVKKRHLNFGMVLLKRDFLYRLHRLLYR